MKHIFCSKSSLFHRGPFRKVLGYCFLLGLLASFGSCSEKLVETSYATLDKKSINGIDALRGILKQRAQSYLETSYLTRRVRKEADLVVFVERAPFLYPADFFAKFESWLTGKELPKAEPDLIEPSDSVQNFSEPSFFASSFAAAFVRTHLSGGLFGDEKQKTWFRTSQKESQKGKKYFSSESKSIEKKKTFLYFVQDTNANLPFFERVYNDLQKATRQKNYIQLFLERSRELRESPSFSGELPFGQRFLSRKGGPLLRASELLWEEEVFPKGVAYFPVRMVSSPPVANYVKGVSLRFRTLLSTRRGEVLIREFFFPKVRLLLVYNTEPFLNYSLVRRPYQRLAADLLDYALSEGEPNESSIALIRELPIPPLQAREGGDEGLSRIFFVYPINLLIISFLMFLLFFLLFRWPHKRRPLPMPKRGSRIFLEHFRALGVHLSRSKDKEEVLERLLAFKKARISHVSKNTETKAGRNNLYKGNKT